LKPADFYPGFPNAFRRTVEAHFLEPAAENKKQTLGGNL
jgi:hypothetical protein